ncbi:MAG TPA: hypothetical protein PLD10_20250 [Rhodopila sp.]|nr:hypothetical protein [Rhodopila sp.]
MKNLIIAAVAVLGLSLSAGAFAQGVPATYANPHYGPSAMDHN